MDAATEQWYELEEQDYQDFEADAERPEEIETEYERRSDGGGDTTIARGGDTTIGVAAPSGESWHDIEPAESGEGGGGGQFGPPADKKADVDLSKVEKGVEDAAGAVPLIGGALKGAMKTLAAVAGVGLGVLNKGSRVGSATAFTQGGGGGGNDQLGPLLSAIKKAGGGRNRM